MKKLSPNHRYLTVKAAIDDGKKAPADGLMGELYALLTGKKASGVVEHANDIYIHDFKRETLESLLLAGATPKEIEQTVDVNAGIVKAYQALFFDPTVFDNMLDRIQYSGEYTKSRYGQDMKKLAVNLGKEVLKVRLSQGNYAVSPDVAKSTIRATAYMMAQLAKANPIDSSISREAQRWAQICLKASADEKDIRTDDASSLRMELEKYDVSETEESSGISPDEILH